MSSFVLVAGLWVSPSALAGECKGAIVTKVVVADRDAYVYKGLPFDKFGAGTYMLAGYRAGFGDYETLVGFSADERWREILDGIESGLHCLVSARFEAYMGDPAGDVPQAVDLWSTTEFDEPSVHWSTRPSAVTLYDSVVPAIGWTSWDVTALAEDWVRASHDEGGFVLLGGPVGASTWSYLFYTRENAANVPPQLVLELQEER